MMKCTPESSEPEQSLRRAPSRREFLLALAGVGAATLMPGRVGASDKLGRILPTRQLGATGESVTMLGFGGFHAGWPSEKIAAATIDAALEGGIRFFDTAENYARGASEERYGRYLVPRYRDQIYLMTKSHAHDAAEARRHLDLSRKRMGTDVIDLWQLHALKSPEDVDARLKAGVLDVFLDARERGIVRHLGFTGHASPYAHLRMLDLHGGDATPFAACQFPVNPVDAGSAHSFVERVAPVALKAGIALLAMKTLADGRFFADKTVNGRTVWQSDSPVVPGRLGITECLHFAWSLPVAVLITGAEKPEFLADKIAACHAFVQMDAERRGELVQKVADVAEAGEVEYYKLEELRRPPA